MSWIEENMKNNLTYEYYCPDLDKYNVRSSMRGAYFLEYMRLLLATDFDPITLKTNVYVESNGMVPLASFVKNDKEPEVQESLDDVISILSKLEKASGTKIQPILVETLDNDETRNEVEKTLKETNMIVLTNAIQSYWALGNKLCVICHFVIKKLFF